MIEVTGNLWTYPADFRVITTNGTVRVDGCCVMGRGCAKEAKELYPGLARLLGKRIKERGNIVHYFDQDDLGYVAEPIGLFTFPVKHVWHERADPDLIRQSVDQLRPAILRAIGTGFDRFVMPRPGCGNGQLTWEKVRPLLVDLPDTVFVIDFDRSQA